MKVLYQSQVNNLENILKEFLFLAIYTPPGDSPPERGILEDPKLVPYYQAWGQKDDHVLFAVSIDQPIGACWSRCYPEEAPGYGTIASNIPELSIAVLPEFRGMGVGTQLLGKFLNTLQPRYEGVSLSVHAINPAKALYQRFGFVRYDQKGESIIMIKEFS